MRPLRAMFRLLGGAVREHVERAAEGLDVKHVPHAGDPLVTKYRVTDDLLGDLAAAVGWALLARAAALGPRVHVRLHHFHRGDADPFVHSHPWRLGVSLILAGGYREQRGYRPRWREFAAGDVNVIWPWTVHRVELDPGRDAWTLFVHDGARRPWGFLVPRELFVSATRPERRRP